MVKVFSSCGEFPMSMKEKAFRTCIERLGKVWSGLEGHKSLLGRRSEKCMFFPAVRAAQEYAVNPLCSYTLLNEYHVSWPWGKLMGSHQQAIKAVMIWTKCSHQGRGRPPKYYTVYLPVRRNHLWS